MDQLNAAAPATLVGHDFETPQGRGGSAIHPLRVRWPQYEQDEIDAATAVLRSGHVNSLVHGDQCRAFESEFAAYCGAPFAISVANGTVALELALRALEVGPGDEVILPARSFFASASSIVAVGATPAFADVDATSHTIDIASARALVNDRTRAIICVHLGGWPCDMQALLSLADEFGLWMIEDCAQAHGAAIGGRRVGSFGHAAAFSFCTDKIISTGGEGGMLLLQDEAHWGRAWAYKDHGKNPAKVFSPSTANGYRYIHDSFGTNFRMTEFQAAIGRVQLRKLPRWLEQRRANARTLSRLLNGHPLIEIPRVPADVYHAYYKYYVQLDLPRMNPATSAGDLVAALTAAGIPASGGSCPDMSREKAVKALKLAKRDELRVAEEVGRRSLMFPVDHLLREPDMEQIALVLRTVLNRFNDLPGGVLQ